MSAAAGLTLKRKLSFAVSRMWQRWVRRSSKAVVILASPKTVAHSLKPGKSQQNAYVERYNRTVRHEWLDLYIFETIEDVQDIATDWLWAYNNERPNMGIGGITPAQKPKMVA